MNTYDFTLEDVRLAVLALADENPDAVYEQPGEDADTPNDCSYLDGEAAGRKGCLFGQAFRRLGVSDDDLIELDRRGVGASGAVLDLLGLADATESQEIDRKPFYRAFDRAQTNQDAGAPWGESVSPLRKEVQA